MSVCGAADEKVWSALSATVLTKRHFPRLSSTIHIYLSETKEIIRQKRRAIRKWLDKQWWNCRDYLIFLCWTQVYVVLEDINAKQIFFPCFSCPTTLAGCNWLVMAFLMLQLCQDKAPWDKTSPLWNIQRKAIPQQYNFYTVDSLQKHRTIKRTVWYTAENDSLQLRKKSRLVCEK